MPTLIDRVGLREDAWRVPETNADAIAEGFGVLLTLAQWQEDGAVWRARAPRLGVLLGPADDPAEIADDLDALSLIAVDFPSFTDGRGYSTARLLRERHGWQGELRAVGEVLRDQLFLLSRCGFDSFALADGQPVDEALAAFADFSEVYQSAADRGPLFARRAASQGRAAAQERAETPAFAGAKRPAPASASARESVS